MGSPQPLLRREQEKEGISVRLGGGLSPREVGALGVEWAGGSSFFPQKQAVEGPWLLGPGGKDGGRGMITEWKEMVQSQPYYSRIPVIVVVVSSFWLQHSNLPPPLPLEIS